MNSAKLTRQNRASPRTMSGGSTAGAAKRDVVVGIVMSVPGFRRRRRKARQIQGEPSRRTHLIRNLARIVTPHSRRGVCFSPPRLTWSRLMDIVWLRDDFRLDDQPAVAAAGDRPALFVYVHDQRPTNGRPLGGAALWRLSRSLGAMEGRLAASGARLDILQGEPERTILALAAAAGADRVFWTRRTEGAAIALDGRVKAALKGRGVAALSFNGRLL